MDELQNLAIKQRKEQQDSLDDIKAAAEHTAVTIGKIEKAMQTLCEKDEETHIEVTLTIE